MDKFVKPFRVGDRVLHRAIDGRKENAIVAEVTAENGTIEYATTLGAWFRQEDMELIEECSEKSLKEMFTMQAVDDGEDEDEWEPEYF